MSVHLRRYNVTLDLATAGSMRVRIPIRKAGSADFATGSDWSPANGDIKVARDGGSPANIGTLPSYSNGRWEFTLSGTELSARTVDVTIVDSATKAVDDEAFTVETYGHASAMYPTVYSGGSAGNLLTSGTGADQIQVNGSGKVSGVVLADTATALTNLDAAALRAAVGLAGATLDTDLTGIATTATLTYAQATGANDKLPGDWAKAGDAMALTGGERTTLAAAVWAALTTGLTAAGSIGKRLADFVTTLVYAAPPVAAPTAAQNAAAVRDVSNAAPAAGSLGEAVNNAGGGGGTTVNETVTVTETDVVISP